MKENIPVTGIGDESSDIEDKSMNYGNENPDFQDASNFTNHIWMTRNVMEIVARGTKHHSRALYNVSANFSLKFAFFNCLIENVCYAVTFILNQTYFTTKVKINSKHSYTDFFKSNNLFHYLLKKFNPSFPCQNS